jgi:serine/threonine protein kinase
MAGQIIQPLPQGFMLGEYRIDRKIGGGGFGMVYLAFEPDGRPVAIKEYSPDGVVRRVDDGTVQPISEEKSRSFHHGMKYFFEEGRVLAQIQHPNVVRVLNFFRANDTVYMVMQYEKGKTLQHHIRALGDEAMREGFLRRIFVQLLNGLREVHARKLLHLDIKPSNIYIRDDGSPVLLDFGAARQASSQDNQRHSQMYTPGFAAPEQYNQQDRLGPWTDIYGVGASLYTCLAKAAPPPANVRQQDDTFRQATEAFSDQYSPDLLALIDSMLRLNYMQRPQSVFMVQKRLVELVSHPPTARPAEKPSMLARIIDRLNKPL